MRRIFFMIALSMMLTGGLSPAVLPLLLDAAPAPETTNRLDVCNPCRNVCNPCNQ